MTPSNTTTQPAHLIRMECNGCGGFGRQNSKDPMQDDRTCLYCIRGQIEYMVGIIKFQPSDPCFVIQPNDPDYKDCENGLVYDDDNFKWYTWPEVSSFKLGATVPTQEGPRIAGEVEIKTSQEIYDKSSDYYRKVLKTKFIEGNEIQPDDYLCIAKSHPVKAGKE